MANSRLLAVLDSLYNNKLLGVSVSHSNSSWRAGLDSLDTRLKFNLKEAFLLAGLHTNLQTKL